ncbi:MAG: thiamine phosphate synthase [Acidobacteria bacterium]|nr:thiamine phosphate synthase [Acidobacteriota bacterium]
MPRPDPWPRLYAVLDVESCARSARAPADVLDAFMSAGVQWLQLRAKASDARSFLELARLAVARTRGRALVIVNDRVDIAQIAGADGVHVGQDDLAPDAARQLLGPDAIVGFSTHDVPQVDAALTMPIDYVAIGPVFGTATKDTGYAAVGLEMVAAAATRAHSRGLAVVAIGGITVDNAASVLAAGADSVCVISDLLRDEPGARAAALLQAVNIRASG